MTSNARISLGDKIEIAINKLLPDKSKYSLPDQLKNTLNCLVREDSIKSIDYLKRSISNAKPIALVNSKWNIGWSENLNMYMESGNYQMLTPLYTGKLPYIRLFRELFKIQPRENEQLAYVTLEQQIFSELYDNVITEWIEQEINENNLDTSNPIDIVELGCGSCQHIPRINKILKQKGIRPRFTVSDWSESPKNICVALKEREDIDVNFATIDLLGDLSTKIIPKNSIVYTINALEQLGDKAWRTIDWILNYSPKLVIHFEPITEVLDPGNEMDALSINYILARRYLKGLFAALATRESLGLIDIIMCKRSFIANAHHENNTVAIWRPSHESILKIKKS